MGKNTHYDAQRTIRMSIKRWYYWWRCYFGRPVCYRKYPPYTENWWYSMCKSCHRQAEFHRD